MSNLKNRVQLIGHLGANPETKVINNKYKVTRLSVATNEKYKNSNGDWQEDTQWHTVTAWGNIAERSEKQLNKGSFVFIEGKLVHNQYVDHAGMKRYFTEVKASNFVVLDKKNSNLPFNPSPELQEESIDLPF